MDWGGVKGGGDPAVGHYLFPPTGLMASETHLQQLKRHRQPESSPVDARRRRSPAFGTWPSCKTTPTYSSLLFFFSSLDYGVLHLCVSGPAYVYVCCVCFPFWVYVGPYSGGPLRSQRRGPQVGPPSLSPLLGPI